MPGVVEFNKMMDEFLKQLRETFPKLTREMKNYKNFKNTDYIKDFVKGTLPYMDYFSNAEYDIFTTKYKRAFIVPGLKYGSVLKRSPSELKEVIGDYVRELYFLGNESGLYTKLAQRISDSVDDMRWGVIRNHKVIVANYNGEEIDNNFEENEFSSSSSDDEEEGTGFGLPPSVSKMAMKSVLEGSELGKMAKSMMGDISEEDFAGIDMGELMTSFTGNFQRMINGENVSEDELFAGMREIPVFAKIQDNVDKMFKGEEEGFDMESLISGSQNLLGMFGLSPEALSEIVPNMGTGTGTGTGTETEEELD
jgi:hypothetical protein